MLGYEEILSYLKVDEGQQQEGHLFIENLPRDFYPTHVGIEKGTFK